jgi:hypothetical protein
MPRLTVNQLINKFTDTTKPNSVIQENSNLYQPMLHNLQEGYTHPLYDVLRIGVVTERIIADRQHARSN